MIEKLDEVQSEPSVVDPPEPDPSQLHNLVTEYSDAVFRLAYSILRDRSLAEDVSQETMVKAWLALPSFRGEGSLKGWILRIAYNTSISTIRSRRSIVVDPHTMPELDEIPELSVENRVESKAAYVEFLSALNLLDDLSRSIVVLREIEGLSYDEIVEILKVPLPTVKTRLFRARRRLEVALKEWAL